MRIHITGNAGAGKTTLARVLSVCLRIPVYHPDPIVWKSGWVKATTAEKEAGIAALVKKPARIIEGVADTVRQAADVVVVVDAPRMHCIFRCVKRCFQYGFSTREELPSNCPEMSVLFKAVRIAWRYPALIGHRIQCEAMAADNYLVIPDAIHCAAQPEALVHNIQALLTQRRQ